MDKILFLRKIDNFIKEEKLLSKGDTVIMGVSGGADSVCLFTVMNKLKDKYGLKLVVVCVDHGLRKEALEEQRYVEDLCKKQGILYIGKKADVTGYASKNGLGCEEAGRILRYGIFEEIAAEYGDEAKIAVAHNANDVAETFLFNLFRGTGPRGLAALRPGRDRIIRPILCVERSEIEEYLREEGIRFYTDASNLSDDYTRNRIRHHILEYAREEINPSSVRHAFEAAEKIRELNDYAERISEKKLSEKLVSSSENEVIIKRAVIKDEESCIAGIIIKKCIDMLVPNNKDIMASHMKAVEELSSRLGTGEANLPYGITVMASGDLVRFSKGTAEDVKIGHLITGENGTIYIEGYGNIEWKVEKKPENFVPSTKIYTKSFDYDKINDCLSIRYFEQKDFITINKDLQKKKLSDYFTNEKIPVFERKKKFVLADGDNVWWILGMRIGEYPKITDKTKTIITFHINKEET